MIRALGVEWLRLRRRRAALLLTVLSIVGCLTALGFAIGDASPPSAAARAAAQSQVQQQLSDPAFQEQLAECEKAVAAGGSDQFPAGMDCKQAMTPRLEWYLNWQPPDFVRDFRTELLAVTLILALGMALVGVTFAGADFSSGTIGTQLLYQPRRTLVFGSKAGAMVTTAAVVGVVGALLAWGASYFLAATWGTTELLQDGPNGPIPMSVGGLIAWAVRAVVGVAAAGLGGFALATLFRSSLVAVSIVAGYGMVGEAVIRALFRGAEQYLVSSRVLAWLQGPYRITQFPQCNGPGEACQPITITISVTDGGVYLLVLLAIVTVAAGVTFARRDVT